MPGAALVDAYLPGLRRCLDEVEAQAVPGVRCEAWRRNRRICDRGQVENAHPALGRPIAQSVRAGIAGGG